MIRFLLPLLIVLLTVAPLSAQSFMPLTLYAGGGASFPANPEGFKDNFKTGYHFSAGVGWKLMPIVEAVGRLEMHRMALKDEIASLADNPDDVPDLTVWMVGVDGKINFGAPGSSTRLYGLAGIGVAHVTTQDYDDPDPVLDGIRASFDNDDFYYQLGAGLEFGSKLKLFVQGRWTRISINDETITMIPVTAGLKFF